MKEVVINVDIGHGADGVEVARKIKLSITPELARRMLGVIDSDILGVCDKLNFSLGDFVALNEECEEIELEWRPTVASAVIHGSSDNLNDLFVTVGCIDCPGEFMFGVLPLTHEEIEEIAKSEEGSFWAWVETTIIRKSILVQGKRGELETILDNDADVLHDEPEEDCESVVCFSFLSKEEAESLNKEGVKYEHL